MLRTFITIGVASFLLISILLNEVKAPDYVFMLVVLGFQVVMSAYGNIEQERRKWKKEREGMQEVKQEVKQEGDSD